MNQNKPGITIEEAKFYRKVILNFIRTWEEILLKRFNTKVVDIGALTSLLMSEESITDISLTQCFFEGWEELTSNEIDEKKRRLADLNKLSTKELMEKLEEVAPDNVLTKELRASFEKFKKGIN